MANTTIHILVTGALTLASLIICGVEADRYINQQDIWGFLLMLIPIITVTILYIQKPIPTPKEADEK